MENKIVKHIEVNGTIYDVPSIYGLDFTKIEYSAEYNAYINQYYKDKIAYAEEIKKEIETNIKSDWRLRFNENQNILFFPQVDFSNITNLYQAIANCKSMIALPNIINSHNATSFDYFLYNCGELKFTPVIIYTDNATSIGPMFYGCGKVSRIKLSSVAKATHISTAFANCPSLITLEFDNWKASSIPITSSPSLSSESIRYILDHACTIEEGATNRTLTLHATAKTNFQNSFASIDDYNAYIAEIASTKDITIA